MKTEPQMATVITTIATTNAQTSLLRLSEISARCLVEADHDTDDRDTKNQQRQEICIEDTCTSLRNLARLRNHPSENNLDSGKAFPHLDADCAETDFQVLLGGKLLFDGVLKSLEVLLGGKLLEVLFGGQLFPAAWWMVCHKELRNDRDRGEVAYGHHSIIKAIQKY